MRRSKDGGVTGNQFAPKRGAALLAEGEHSGLHSCGLESLRVSGSNSGEGGRIHSRLQSPLPGPGRGSAEGAGLLAASDQWTRATQAPPSYPAA